jgi:1-deoxy-D-xylulose-5-phosphate synthase
VYKGLSGFPKRSESAFDAFGVGHSSTSISAALGMAVASRLQGNTTRQHVAVIGDGAMTAGMAFEGLNHGGVENSNLLVVLNDNCMSIDPNVGALKEYLTDITTSPAYNSFKEDVWNALEKLQHVGKISQKLLSKMQQTVKSGLLKQSNLFEALRFRYFGPVDGHDVLHLVKLFRDLKQIPGPKLLHCLTVKGKGFAPAEKDQTKWHAPGLFDKISGEIYKRIPETPQPPKYQDVFGHTLVELADANPKVVGVTPAMLSGCSMTFLQQKHPSRTFDVGIAEQHAVTFSAGMASAGLTPFCNIYSSFMQRAYDQVVHDVAIQKLKVIFCLDRAGLAGADGPTHHGALDLSYMRSVPNLVVCAPMNEEELRNMMYTAQLPHQQSSMVIRYPRGNGVMVDWRTPFREMEIGKGRVVRDGTEVAFVTIGHPGNFALKAALQLEKEGISAGVYDMRFTKPLDEALLHQIFEQHREIITVEDGTVLGGFGGAVAEFATTHGYTARITRLGMPDRVVEHGEQSELYAECGFDVASLTATAKEKLGQPVHEALHR